MFGKKLKTVGVAALAVMMSGCFKTRIVIDVSRDATAGGSISLLMSEKMLTTGGTSVEEALEEMKQNYASEIKDREIVTIREGEGEDAYAGVKIIGMPLQEGDYTLVKEGNTITLSVPLGNVQDEIADETGGQSQMSPDALKELGAEATLTVNMPGKATSNIGTVNDKTVVVDLFSPDAAGTLVVTCKVGPSGWVIMAIIVCAAMVLSIVGFIISRRKKTV